MTDPKNLENRLHEKADPARAVSTGRVRYTLAELLADAEASGAYPLPPEEREWMERLMSWLRPTLATTAQTAPSSTTSFW